MLLLQPVAVAALAGLRTSAALVWSHRLARKTAQVIVPLALPAAPYGCTIVRDPSDGALTAVVVPVAGVLLV
jgi:hypothetical protein